MDGVCDGRLGMAAPLTDAEIEELRRRQRVLAEARSPLGGTPTAGKEETD